MKHTPGFYLLQKHVAGKTLALAQKRIKIARAQDDYAHNLDALINKYNRKPTKQHNLKATLAQQNLRDAVRFLEAAQKDYDDAEFGELIAHKHLVDTAEELAYLLKDLHTR